MILAQTTTTGILDSILGLFGLDGTTGLGTAGLLGVVVFGVAAWWLWRWWRN